MNIDEIYQIIYKNHKIVKLEKQINKMNEIRDKTLEIWKNCMDKYDCNNCPVNNLCNLYSKHCSMDYREIMKLVFERKELFLKLLMEYF